MYRYLSFKIIILLISGMLMAGNIHEMSVEGNLKGLEEILSNDPSPVNMFDERGHTPLNYAAFGGQNAVIDLLLKYGADLQLFDRDGNSSLHWAAFANKPESAEYLIQLGIKKSSQNSEGLTALSLAVIQGHKEMAELLINNDMKPDVRDNNENSLLYLAVNYNHPVIVEYLISLGRKGELVNDTGDTPLHAAAWNGNIEIARMLIDSGEKIDYKNNSGFMPVDYALKANHKEMIELLSGFQGSSVSEIKKNEAHRKETLVMGNQFKLTILYDNYIFTEGTRSDWGFACLIETPTKTILFDTGTKPDILFHNIEKLKVNINSIDQIVISHNHHDHTGGLARVLESKQDLSVYIPHSFPLDFVRMIEQNKSTVIPVDGPVKIAENVWLTGEMGSRIKEQSLILETAEGLVIVTGCSHQGIVDIIRKAKEMLNKDVCLVMGGFHLMNHSEQEMNHIIDEFKKLGVKKCGASHCTGDQPIEMFKKSFGENYIGLGTGRVIFLNE